MSCHIPPKGRRVCFSASTVNNARLASSCNLCSIHKRWEGGEERGKGGRGGGREGRRGRGAWGKGVGKRVEGRGTIRNEERRETRGRKEYFPTEVTN